MPCRKGRVLGRTSLWYLFSSGHSGCSDDLIDLDFGEKPVVEAQDRNPVGGADSTLDRANSAYPKLMGLCGLVLFKSVYFSGLGLLLFCPFCRPSSVLPELSP